MPEQDYTTADRFGEMRLLIHPDTAEEPWRWGNVRTVVLALIEEAEEHSRAIYALQVLENARGEGRRMTRQDLIGGQPSPMMTHLAAAAIGAPVGSPEHMAELRTALAEARRELGVLFSARHERDEARRENRKLREEAKYLTTAVRDLLSVLDSIDDGRDFEHGAKARTAQATIREFLATRVRGWGDEDG